MTNTSSLASSPTSRTARSIVAALGMAGMLAYAMGCDPDDDGTGVIDEIQIAGSCDDYCEKAGECNSDVDVDACKEDCEDTLSDCMADEQEQAINEVDECSEEACNDFLGCTIGAGLQCSFGI